VRRGKLRAPGFNLGLFCVLLFGLEVVAVPAEPKKLLQRPHVAKPPCSDPKPYRVESWDQSMNNFRIRLAVSSEDVVLEDKRLHDKYVFGSESAIAFISNGVAELWVDWIEPEQVAALRCESVVVEIGFIRILTTNTSRRHRATAELGRYPVMLQRANRW
jgi:hypothetical protein